MVKDQVSINLLENKGKGIVERFLDWSLAIGRLLIIVTETVALAAFLYRFSIDRRLIDLSDEIKKNQAIVTYFQDGEVTFRTAQQKLLVSRTYNATSRDMLTLFKDMLHLAQNDITFTNLTVESGEMKISVQANDVSVLSTFADKLQRHPLISSLSVDKVENRTASSTIIVSITARLKGQTATPSPAIQRRTNEAL